MASSEKKDHENHGNNEGASAQNEVFIKVNDVSRKIHRGNQTVVSIKTIGGVPLAHELEQLVAGKLIPLEDSSSVVIKGGEEFIGHLRDGSSS